MMIRTAVATLILAGCTGLAAAQPAERPQRPERPERPQMNPPAQRGELAVQPRNWQQGGAMEVLRSISYEVDGETVTRYFTVKRDGETSKIVEIEKPGGEEKKAEVAEGKEDNTEWVLTSIGFRKAPEVAEPAEGEPRRGGMAMLRPMEGPDGEKYILAGMRPMGGGEGQPPAEVKAGPNGETLKEFANWRKNEEGEYVKMERPAARPDGAQARDQVQQRRGEMQQRAGEGAPRQRRPASE